MIEFSIPDFNETIIKNIISLFLSFSNTERREVVFCTLWFIGQYCSERGERVLLSLYLISILTLHFTDAKVNFPGKSTFAQRFLTLSTNHRRESKFAQGSFTFAIITTQCTAFHHFLNAQQATKAAIFDASVG